jgi:Tfp pilus assembly protein PilV
MHTIKPPSQTGFAIVEVLIATVVLAIGFIELTRAFSNISSVAVRAVAMSRASNLTNAIMERVMAQDFDAKGNEAGGYALDFDGNNDWVDVGAVHNDIQTISFWIQADAADGTRNVIDLNGADYIQIVDGEVTADGITSPTYYINAEEGERTITAGAWYHVAVTTATSIEADDAGDVDIGRVVTVAPGDEEYFDGKIDEVRLWDNVRTPAEILANYNGSISDPYEEANLKLYLRMNNGTGTIAFDNSLSMAHGALNNMDDADWVTGYSTSQGREGETTWSGNNDVDDFHTVGFKDSDYTGLDAGSNNFSGLGGRVYVKYISLNGGSGTSEDPYTFNDSGTPTDYKQITVKVGFPGTTDSTQLDAIKSAKVDQGYSSTFSPYGI